MIIRLFFTAKVIQILLLQEVEMENARMHYNDIYELFCNVWWNMFF